jgi:hypothetical protein
MMSWPGRHAAARRDPDKWEWAMMEPPPADQPEPHLSKAQGRYLLSVNWRGRRYNYFRPGTQRGRLRLPTVRLSDDTLRAAAEAESLAALAEDAAAVQLFHAQVRPLMKAARLEARAARANYELSELELFGLLRGQGGCCALSGVTLVDPDPDPAAAACQPLAPTLERKDLAAGYRADNIWIVCNLVRSAGRAWGMEAFMAVARAAAARPANSLGVQS